MKYNDISDLSTKELGAKLKEEKERLNKLTFNHTVSPVENPSQIKATKKVIARILTEMRKRQLEGINK